jgi:ribosomal protein S27E
MKKFHCGNCKVNYYGSSSRNNLCDVCGSEIIEVKIGKMSISEKEKNIVNEKWDKLKTK